MPPGAATHGNRCQTVAGRTHPWRGTRQRRRHFRRGVLAACGRARWKIENETFNVLKTNGYNLEHNFGHGKKTLASVLVTLNLLAFAFHTAAYLGVIAWRAAVIARGPTYRFFEHLRTITAYVVFPDWPSLLRPIAAAALRPPCPEARLPPSRHSIHLNTEPKRRKTSTKSEFRIAGDRGNSGGAPGCRGIIRCERQDSQQPRMGQSHLVLEILGLLDRYHDLL